ncbi:Coatomer beta subunit [Trema orientale]|uniref:Coatomer beta subunit n=1 Tax=Trema orientale TaxID=63057 RepID=A0A2P5ENS4_TREOI|nr:Coatomer beta subunit [Trema orientale]
MSESFSTLYDLIVQLSESIREALSETQYTPPPAGNFSVKAVLDQLLPRKPTTTPEEDPILGETQIRTSIKDFTLACALLSSARSSTHDLLSWIPGFLSASADSAFRELSKAHCVLFSQTNAKRVGELGLDCGMVAEERRLVVELMPEVVRSLKEAIKESSVDKSADVDEFSAASARAAVGFAIVAAYQFRWFVTQIDYPHLGKLCGFVIPCALTALDHWSPEVKRQGMVSFIHIGKNVDAAELGLYEDVILDACCQNIASDDEIWHLVVEMSVLLVTCFQRSNPRSPWFEKMLNEMLSHLERQPRNKDRRVAWLQHIEPLFNSVGLVLLAHFRRIFPLFFQWMHADDDETVLLVLKQVYTVIRLTWIRNTPYVDRLVDELAVLHKRASLKKSHEDIKRLVSQILTLLQQCKGLQFEAAYGKHRDDPDLTDIILS